MVVHNLIAHFLKENNYHETLKIFEQEYGKPIPHNLPTNETLEEIVRDRINYSQLDHPIKILETDELLDEDSKSIIKNQIAEWGSPYPNIPEVLNEDIHGLVLSTCLFNQKNNPPLLLLSTVDLKLTIINLETKKIIFDITAIIGRVVIKKILNVNDDGFMLVGMNGKIYYYELELKNDNIDLTLVSELQAHKKLIIDLKMLRFNDDIYLFSLGWDFLLKVFKFSDNSITFISELKLTSQGTCFDVVEYDKRLVIVLGKTENTLLDVLTLENDCIKLLYKISLNDAEFTSSSFSPRCLAIQKLSNSIPLIAVGTSHEPYLRLIIVSLKELSKLDGTGKSDIKRNQILKNLNTLSPQDKYSRALICWRIAKDKSTGVWIVGEDGVIRGIDLLTDRVLIELNGHKGKIKSFTTGLVGVKEMLFSCGADRDVKLWLD